MMDLQKCDAVRLDAPPAPSVVRASLPRVLYAALLNPGHKFGTIEEQMVVLAERFRAEDGLFLPLFICPPDVGSLDCFLERGVHAERLDLTRFRWSSLRQL